MGGLFTILISVMFLESPRPHSKYMRICNGAKKTSTLRVEIGGTSESLC